MAVTPKKETGRDQAGTEIAAIGDTAGAVHSAGKSVDPSPIYKGFVDRCLRERGYEVIGWQ